MSKNLLQIFNRYTPDQKTAEILLSADPSGILLRADKQQRIIEVTAPFPRIVPRATLYRIEEEIRAVYELNMVRICPRYEAALFDVERIPDLLMETNRRGIVANGFFNRCEYRLSGDSLVVEIPFSEGGIHLIYDAKTPRLMEELIKAEYGVELHIEIRRMESFDPTAYEREMQEQLAEMGREAARAQEQYVAMQREARSNDHAFASPDEEEEMLPRAVSIYDPAMLPEISEGICKIGFATYDLTSPEYVLGEPFEIRPVTIASIDKPQRNLVIVGEIFGFTKEESRGGD